MWSTWYLLSSYMEWFTTATGPFWVGVVEYKLWFDLVVNKVHFCANQEKKSFRVDNHSDVTLFDQFIELAYIVALTVLHDIAVAIAATTSDSNSYPEYFWWLWFLLNQFSYSVRCSLCLHKGRLVRERERHTIVRACFLGSRFILVFKNFSHYA